MNNAAQHNLGIYRTSQGDWIVAESEDAAQAAAGQTPVTYCGDYEYAVNLMDDDLREDLHTAEDWTSEEQFFRAYLKAHADRFGEEFRWD